MIYDGNEKVIPEDSPFYHYEKEYFGIIRDFFVRKEENLKPFLKMISKYIPEAVNWNFWGNVELIYVPKPNSLPSQFQD